MLYHEYGTITVVEITGVKEPVVGEPTAIKASDLTLVSSPANACTTVSAQWYNGTDNTSADTTFKAGCEYYLIVTLTPADGCNFKWGSSGLTCSGKATINGVNARMKIRTSLTAKNLKIYSEYYTPAPCKHTSTEVRNAKAATCTAEGYSGDTYCKVCGEVVESGHSIAKTAHTESGWITDKAAAPGVEGSKHKECTVCHTTLKTETIPALKVECKHTNTEIKNAVKATCMEEGYTGDTVCKDCGKTITAGMKLPTLGHDFEDGVCTQCGAKDPDYKPAETEPVVTEPVVTEPLETEPAETYPVETTPAETKPTETEPTGTEPTATEPTATDPVGTDAVGTDVPGTDAAGTEQTGETEKTSSLWWLWIIIAFLVGVGGVFAVYKMSEKKKQD
ncbi:MAG: hypothetical protein MJ070_01625 [Lachnospiraceae bacterium]|nr:hypothetical protein [Lachnospiraceae bacterium]